MGLSWLGLERKRRWFCTLVTALLTLMTCPAWCQNLEDLSRFATVSTANEHSTLDRGSRTLTSTVDITIANSSTQSLSAPLHGVIDVGGADVQIPGALGGPKTSPYDKFYFDLTSLLTNGHLSPSESVTFHATFVRPASVKLTYQVKPYGNIEPPIDHIPTANSGLDQTIELAPGHNTAHVILDGSASSDPEGPLAEYRWTGDVDPADVVNPELDLGQGTYTFQLVVVDATGHESTPDTVTVTVRLPGNQPPRITSTPLTEAVQYYVYYYQVLATDPEGGAVTYKLIHNPPGMAIDEASGMLVWTPDDKQAAVQTVELEALDPQGAAATQSFTVNVAATNLPPQFTSVPKRVAKVGEAYVYAATAHDPEGAPMTFSFASDPPAGVSIDGTVGAVAWTPGAQDVGPHDVALRVMDSAGATDEQRYTLQVIDPQKMLEVLQPSGEREILVGQTLDLPVESNYPEATFTTDPVLPHSAIEDGHFTFTPTTDQVGTHTLSFEAHFAEMGASSTVVVTVRRENRLPEIAAVEPQSVNEGQQLRFTVVATDADGDPVDLSAVGGLPENAVFNQITHEVLFTPSFDQAGDYAVQFAASDGHGVTTGAAAVAVVDVAPGLTNLELNIDKPASPTFLAGQTVSGTINGAAGPPRTAPMIFVSGLAPNSVRQGQSVSVDITGLNTEFTAGGSLANFGDGMTVEKFEVLSPTSAKATIKADELATLGVRQIFVTQGGLSIYSLVAFNVEAGAASVTGTVADPFTHVPIVGARVGVEGTSLFVLTDAQGHFSLEGLPAGKVTILVTRPNFDVLRFELSVSANQTINLEESVPLNVLAREPQPRGSLPRAATLASILDRGVGALSGSITIEQAEALVTDTLLTVGGTDVGVYDAEGKQLNPKVTGPGLMTLTPDGVHRQAEALRQGDTYRLDDIVEFLADGFTWVGDNPPTTPDIVRAFQQSANDAWANPNAPASAMAIALFNDGTTLQAQPPVITADTTFNRFQSFLLISSFFVHNVAALSDSADALLRSHGIDPDKITVGDYSGVPGFMASAPTKGNPSLLGAFAKAANGVFEWVVGGPVYAAEGGVNIPPPNGNAYYARSDPFSGKTFDRVWTYLKSQTLSNAFEATWRGTLQTMAFQGTAAIAMGSTGGLTGAVVATTIVATAVDGIISSVLQKYLIGAFVAANLQQMTPNPPIPERSQIVGNRLILTFEPSVNDPIRQTPSPGAGLSFHYTYQLYRFPNAWETDVAKGDLINSTLELSGDFPGKLQFVIPVHSLKAGPNFFRIATIQYVLNFVKFFGRDLTLDEAQHFFTYEHQYGADPGEDTLTNELDLISKFQDRLTLAEKQIHADLENKNMTARNRNETLASTRETEVRLNQEIYNICDRRAQLTHQGKQTCTQFNETNRTKLKQSARLHSLMEGAANNGQTLRDPAVANKAMSALGEGVSPELFSTLEDLREATVERNKQSQLLDKHNTGKEALSEIDNLVKRKGGGKNVDYFGTFRKWLPGGSDTDKLKLMPIFPGTTNCDFEFTRFDADGVPEKVTGQVHLDDPTPQFQDLIAEQNTRIQNTSIELAQADANINIHKNDVVEQRVGKKKVQEYQTTKSTERAKILEMEKEYALKGEEVFAARKERLAHQSVHEAAANKIQPWMGRVQKLAKGLEVVGYVANAVEPIEQMMRGLRVLYSDWSPAHMFVYNPRDLFPPAIEIHPDINHWGGFLVGVANGKDGSIDNVYPGQSGPSGSIPAGFPPEYLAVDKDGTIFADNGMSNSRFSGRIFRFDPQEDGAFVRDLAGTINYYSVDLQYGRPAMPIASTIAKSKVTSGNPETIGTLEDDLYIADIDYMANSKRILRLSVSLADVNPAFMNGKLRNRIVGQPFVESADFRFTGPTDMVAGPVDGDFQRIYISDESALFVIVHNIETDDKTLIKLVDTPGRRWSGLALDLSGNLIVAEYNTGQFFFLLKSDLLQAESGDPGTAISPRLLRDVSVRGPGDIELDHSQARLGVSTSDGIQSVTVPATLCADNILGLRVRNFSKVTDLSKLSADGVRPYFSIPVSNFDFENRELTVSVKVFDAELQQTCWRDVTIKMTPFSMTAIVVGDVQSLLRGGN